jgi:dTDP-4-dehydrorhamnose 3,5-epimerase
VNDLAIPDVRVLKPRRFGDDRGWFAETWSRRSLSVDFCQDNMSMSTHVGTVRGLHFQRPPHAQAKLVSVMAGRILDVAVDIRTGSPTYGKHVAVELSASNGLQLFIPRGFAHGFCTLEPATVVMYKVDGFYSPESDAGVFWADPDLGIDWPVRGDTAELSSKDRGLPRFREVSSPFIFGQTTA